MMRFRIKIKRHSLVGLCLFVLAEEAGFELPMAAFGFFLQIPLSNKKYWRYRAFIKYKFKLVL